MNRSSDFFYLHSHEAFFKQHSRLLNFEKNQYFIRSDDLSSDVYFLVDGLVKLSFSSSNQDERIIGYLKPGMTFAQSKSFYEADSGGLEFTTVTRSTMYRVSQHTFIKQLESDPVFSGDYLQQLLRNQIYLLGRSIYVGENDVYHKMLRWLLLMAKYYGEETPEGLRLTPQFTQTTIGNFLHASRESVSNSLDMLQSKGLITLSKKRITITDTDKIRAELG